jgi:hypothetical protein
VPDLAYFEYSSPGKFGEVDLDDPAHLIAGNPGLPHGRPDQEFTAVERAAMTDEEYARERLGIFAEHDDAPTWEVVTEADWKACATEVAEGWMADPVTFALEVSVDRSVSCIAAAGASLTGGVAVEVVDRHEGTDWVLDRLLALQAHNPKALLIDPRSPAGAFLRDLTDAGVTVTEVTSQDYARACAHLRDAIVGQSARKSPQTTHHHQDELDAAVSWAQVRLLGDAFVWNRRGDHDVTALAAVTLARWGHLEVPDPEVVPMVAWV